MNKSLIIAFVMLPTIAFAQQVPSLASEFKLSVTQAELDIISEGLQTQPFGKVAPLVNKLRAQIIEQQKPALPPPVTNEAPK